jgi:hypothetical protein
VLLVIQIKYFGIRNNTEIDTDSDINISLNKSV